MATSNLEAPAAVTRQVIQLPIDEGLTCLRGLSPQRLRFELEYALERGSTANSFLFDAGTDGEGQHQTALLVHPPGKAYGKAFLLALADRLPAQTKALKVVMGHVNPNRVALLRDLAGLYPELELIASNAGAKLLGELCHNANLPPRGRRTTSQPSPTCRPSR